MSVDRVPTSILSRQEAGTRGRTLIVNLPGSPKAIIDCLDAVLPALIAGSPDERYVAVSVIESTASVRLEDDARALSSAMPRWWW